MADMKTAAYVCGGCGIACHHGAPATSLEFLNNADG